MPRFLEYTFPSTDGSHELYTRLCMPDGAPRAVLQISHGVAEHIERYGGFMRYLAKNGVASVGCDHLGHGRSAANESELGWFADKGGWRLVTGDMKRLRDLTGERYPGLPYFLFGHSMGSFLSRTYLIKYPGSVSGCILSGTGQQPGIVCALGALVAGSEIKKHGSKYRSDRLQKMAFGSYNRGFDSPRTKSDWLSRDTDQVDKYEADPLCGFTSSAALFRDMMGGLRFIAEPKNLAAMDMATPVLFISGGSDPVGGNGSGVKKAYASFVKAGVRDASIKLYPDCRHELLNELNRDEVQADVLRWIEGRI